MVDWEQIYYDVTRPFRRVGWSLRLRLAPGTLEKCRRCDLPAVWFGDGDGFCDDHIARGCDCQVIDRSIRREVIEDPPNSAGVELIWTTYPDGEPEQRRDAQGRLLPCVDFWHYPYGLAMRRRP